MLLAALKKLDLPRASDLPKPLLYQLILAYVLICLPMIQLFPIWVTALAGITLALKLTSIRFHFVVSKWLALTMLIGFGALILANASLLGKEYTGIALLFVFASLKILEAREQRDAFLLMLIYLLLIMGALMAQDSAAAFLYLIGCFLYNIYIQLKIAQPPELGLSIKHNLKSIAQMLLISLPFVAALFFLFPRFEPLWKAPNAPGQSVTGLSDEMTPNSLTSLVQDGSLAFRVQFTDILPRLSDLYWRGPVLTQFDGKTWRRGARNQPRQAIRVNKSSAVSYRLYHSGRTDRWLVPLELPDSLPENVLANSLHEMGSPDVLKKVSAFDLTSYTQYRTAAIDASEARENTRLPKGIFPKTRALAATLRQQSQSDEAFANRLWQYFNQQTFYYDLRPPAGNADIDTFMFDNQTGYCEHFTNAFVFMARSQGLTARVVTGYQGGEFNPISKELEVRQLNAHAWAEVYLTGKGWVRYDPTAAVAPDRINLGTPFGSARNIDSINTAVRWQTQSAWLRQLSASFRAANAFWQNWIVHYDSTKQQSIWQRLGLGALQYFAWLIFIMLLVPITLLFAWWYRQYQAARYGDAVYRAIQPFLRYVEKIALPVGSAQSLRDWLMTHEARLGASKQSAEKVIQLYYRMRYSDEPNRDISALDKAIVRFIEQYRHEQRQSQR